MTREEAKMWILNHYGETLDDGTKHSEVIKYVLDLLEQEPCEDAISREDVIQLVKESDIDLRYADGVFEFLSLVKDLPSVQPKIKTGRWIFNYVSADGHRVYHCSECGCYLKPKHSEPLNSFKWCSSCGARMESEE